jgi:hypothetical protein
MALSNSTEVRIIQRGEYYLTPMSKEHIDGFLEVISIENQREILLQGYPSIEVALNRMMEQAEVYIARHNNGDIIFVGGLWHNDDMDFPQMFALFSEEIKSNFKMLARGSLMLVSFFDKTQSAMSMSILSEYSPMVQWATWLGFEPVGLSDHNDNQYVDFVRCNPTKKNVYDSTSRPVMH